MSECKHKVTGAADWQGECPYCKLEQLEMDQVFYRLAIKERDYERERNARLEVEIAEAKSEYPRCPNCEYEVRLSPREKRFLEAERDALKADAERYRYMRDNPITFKGMEIYMVWKPDELDALVDAVRGEG